MLLSTPDHHGYIPGFTALEILGGGASDSKESDVFAFGMVMIEVGDLVSILVKSPDRLMKAFTGKVPFSNCAASIAILRITRGYRPERPTHTDFTDDLWMLVQRCWEGTPQNRPQMNSVIKQLSVFLPNQRENTLFIKHAENTFVKHTEVLTKLHA